MIRFRLTLGEWCMLVLCASLYVASFFLTAVVKGADMSSDGESTLVGQEPMLGWQAFQAAWAFSFGPWWANPCAWFAIVLAFAGRPASASAVGFLGFALAILTVFLSPFRGRFGMLGTGFWIWAGSMALFSSYYLDRALKARVGRVKPSPVPTS